MTPQELVDGLLDTPYGQVSPSAYETGRLVALAPWLPGNDDRLNYLRATQRADGLWGRPDAGYALVPTLSATDAFMAERPGSGAAAQGLWALRRMLGGTRPLRLDDLPDMPAIEVITAALVESINARLDRDLLPLPAGMSRDLLGALRSACAAGAELPTKALHALEILGPIARRLPSVRLTEVGAVGASPAATAAWLDRAAPDCRAVLFLKAAAHPHGGPVPCGLPITVFERAWVLATLARVDSEIVVPPSVLDELIGGLGPTGIAAGDGLPADADTTAGTLHALALLGRPQSPDILAGYELDTHFCTWPGEQGRSVSTNAHVLEAYGEYVRRRPDQRRRHAETIRKVSRWLLAQQSPLGHWTDRWHASPYYATYCAVLALAGFGGAMAVPAVRAAGSWLVATQHPDGSWGRWQGTAEETAYAVQMLLLVRPLSADDSMRKSAARGLAFLRQSAIPAINPPLWHDKDLYAPHAIIQAAVLAALQVGVTAALLPAGEFRNTQDRPDVDSSVT